MPPLSPDHRRQLEKVITDARDAAEEAACAKLRNLGVEDAEPLGHLDAAGRDLRVRLRARGRLAGDAVRGDKTQSLDHLSQELAYEYWHRMLFARFLAENRLLMNPDGVDVTLEECEALAPEASPPAPNGYALAARYAGAMLPQIFRADDVLLTIEFPQERQLELKKLLESLPRETFLADDALGWTYQFWQSRRKEEVNKSEDKIDGDTLSAVTQLFTEPYMVGFLLHNTVGAWWCARNGVNGPPGGAGVPAGAAPVAMDYLRWKDDGTPAAGAFCGWPQTLAEFTMLDPCCGSGHFLVAGFNFLVPLRMHDEKVCAAAACDAVLRENLYGLELDPRCTQIAAFALALAAWKYPGEDGQPLGYRELPTLNIACSGQGVIGKRDDWLKLANGDDRLREDIERLYEMFREAPHLGSLIDPIVRGGPLFAGIYADLQPRLTRMLAKKTRDIDEATVGVAAQGIAKAAELLARRYTLVITNVPYLGRGKQADVMKEYIDEYYLLGKADLATAFVLRCLELCCGGGSAALVTPQTWLFLTTYTKLREELLKKRQWNGVARLGSNAFQDMNFWAATTALTIITASVPAASSELFGIDVSAVKEQVRKASRLANQEATSVVLLKQCDQLKNPDAAISFDANQGANRLSTYATATQGMGTGDLPKYLRQIWELPAIGKEWDYFQTTPDGPGFSGCEGIIRWQEGRGELAKIGTARKGLQVVGKRGVAVAVTGSLEWCHFLGTRFDCTIGVLIPNDPAHLLAIVCYLSDPAFRVAVRSLDQAVSVTEANLLKVPFDLAHWQAVAAEKYPGGLPTPHSTDPTQWLFKGDIPSSTDPLQVAVARLLGYRWPEQLKEPDAVDALVDADGIVCLPGVRGESPAAERVLEALRMAYGEKWSESLLHDLLTKAECKSGATLADWLQNQFFDQHCKRFAQRPFVWHIWDGRKDGFSALVNYHKLTHKNLENLTFSYLGEWIKTQNADAKTGKPGADLRLKAAQELQDKLKMISDGEPPYDIFVRWKPLSQQPIGWNPDLNDGVRVNIRPFVEAGVLRKNPNVKWTKDRGKEPKRDKADYPWFWDGDTFTGDRVNDIHLTTAVKQAARAALPSGK